MMKYIEINGEVYFANTRNGDIYKYTNKGLRLLKQEINIHNHATVKIQGKNYFVHRLVYGIPNKVINHIDGNPLNNCISNLEDVSQKYNVRHQFTHLGRKGGVSKIYHYSLSGKLLKIYNDRYEASDRLGINHNYIADHIRGKINISEYGFFSDRELTEEEIEDKLNNGKLKGGVSIKQYFNKTRNIGKSYGTPPKKIKVYTKDGKYIGKYNSQGEAAIKLFGDRKYRAEIGKCVRGQMKYYKGYIFLSILDDIGDRLKEINKKELYKYSNKNIPVIQKDFNGNIIRKYNSLKEVERNGYNAECIKLCAKGIYKQHKGYKWELLN